MAPAGSAGNQDFLAIKLNTTIYWTYDNSAATVGHILTVGMEVKEREMSLLKRELTEKHFTFHTQIVHCMNLHLLTRDCKPFLSEKCTCLTAANKIIVQHWKPPH